MDHLGGGEGKREELWHTHKILPTLLEVSLESFSLNFTHGNNPCKPRH